MYWGEAKTGDGNSLAATNGFVGFDATTLTVKASSSSASEQVIIRVHGIVRFSSAGTFIPRFVFSSAPGGAPTIQYGTYFRMVPVGDNAVVSAGTWS
jgi:hypothetical protein